MARRKRQPKQKSMVMAGFISPTYVEDKFAVSLASNVINEPRLQGFTSGAGARMQRARNAIITDFMATPEMFEWFWMLDADMILPHDALSTLLHTAETKNRRVVGGLAYIYKPDDNPQFLASIIHYNQDRETFIINEPPTERYIEAAATGFFCLLVHRSVLQEMYDKLHETFNNVWIDEIEQGYGNTPKGPDMEFFERMYHSTGVNPLIDTNVKCGHIKKVVIDHDIALKAWRAQ